MSFSEETKLKIKKQSQFACCLCHAIGIEIHHIIPQNEGGPDVEDNAAPLCPSCHEIYGANPEKRKFIREARDFWYEFCAQKYGNDSSILSEIAERVEQTVSKADLQEAVDALKNIIAGEKNPDDLISVELPDKYWVLVLAALAPQVEIVKARLEELHKLGYTYDNVKQMPEALITAMAGTFFAQGAIIDVLVEKGVMKPEAAKIGTKALMETANKFLKEEKGK